ncbi:MAG: alpha/beta hydrolase fold domain-containing protein [Verrucomicrobiae bacterium]|nr:alpha/beta hydrolase fold domain-containing protein [Verrucomicrobiae bacterium]
MESGGSLDGLFRRARFSPRWRVQVEGVKIPSLFDRRRTPSRAINVHFKILLHLLAALAVVETAVTQERPNPEFRLVEDIPYRAGDTLTDDMKERCRLDLYHPLGVTNFSTVVWFHGGGLTDGNRAVPKGLQEKGLAVVAAGYRLSPQVKAPAYIEDAAAAVAWTFRHIADYGGATNRIFVSGHSAGGYLTSMIGLDKRWLAAHDIDANAIAGLVPYSGQCVTHFTIRAERDIPGTRPIVDDMAPLFHVRKDAPPLLLITGDREMELLGRYEENAYLWRMLKVAGHPTVTLNELDGFDHGQMAEPAHALLVRFVRSVSSKP